MSQRPRVVVVGAGLTGLATAWRLQRETDVVVLEASDRSGGQIRTIEVGGVAMDVGADALLARQPAGPRLATDLGLGEDLVAPAARQVLLLRRGRLHPLPEGTVFGVPADLAALARSGVLSSAALARAAAEPMVPRRHVAGDRSVAELVGERFGREVVDALVEPLLGGVYAGRADELSAEATIAPVWQAARTHRSLRSGLRARPAPPATSAPIFQTVRGGLGRLTDRLAGELGSRLRLGAEARRIVPASRGWVVEVGGDELQADHVVLAVPAPPTAQLLGPIVPDAAREFATVRAASVAVVALAYDAADTVAAPRASGVLVPRDEGLLTKAITLGSRKWPHLVDRERFVVRASVGRIDETAALDLDDDELAARVDAEVRRVLGFQTPAAHQRVVRWPNALPQYDVGHRQRVDRIRHAVRESGLAGLHVAGAALDGVGLSARATEADKLVATILSDVRLDRSAPIADPGPSAALDRQLRSGER